MAVVMAGALALSGCGGSKDGGNSPAGEGPTLTVFAGSQTPIVANFNPYSPTLLPGTLGSIYEPLFFYNKADVGDPVPLLGEKSEWSDDGMSLKVTIRQPRKGIRVSVCITALPRT